MARLPSMAFSTTSQEMQLAPMPTPRATEYMAAIDHGQIFVVGGRTTLSPGGGGELDVVEAYDIAGNTWSTKAPMPERRSDAVVLAQDAHLYVFGGYEPSEPINQTFACPPPR